MIARQDVIKKPRILLSDYTVGRRRILLGKTGNAITPVENREPKVLIIAVIGIIAHYRKTVHAAVSEKLTVDDVIAKLVGETKK